MKRGTVSDAECLRARPQLQTPTQAAALPASSRGLPGGERRSSGGTPDPTAGRDLSANCERGPGKATADNLPTPSALACEAAKVLSNLAVANALLAAWQASARSPTSKQQHGGSHRRPAFVTDLGGRRVLAAQRGGRVRRETRPANGEPTRGRKVLEAGDHVRSTSSLSNISSPPTCALPQATSRGMATGPPAVAGPTPIQTQAW